MEEQQRQQSPNGGKKRVAIIGVTGSVGQEFVQSLEDHPWFEVTQIAASERSAGKNYLDAIRNAGGIIAWDVEGPDTGVHQVDDGALHRRDRHVKP